MPTARPYPLTKNVDGLDVSVDPVFLLDSSSPNIRNVRPDKGVIKKDFSWRLFAAAAVTGIPMLHYKFRVSAGTTYYLLFTTTHMYVFNSTTVAWDQINPDMGDFTGDADDRFSVVEMNDLLIFTNGIDPIQVYNGTTCKNLTGEGIPTKAIALLVFMNHLIALGTTEGGTFYPFRTRWTSSGSTTGWTGGTSGYIDLVDTADWCVCGAHIRSKCFVFKSKTIWELTYVGGAAVFDYILRIDEEGTEAPQGVVSAGEMLIFMNAVGVFSYDGARLTPLHKKIFPLMYEPGTKILNATYIQRTCSTIRRELNEYWMCIPTTTETPTTLLKYNWVTDTWTRKEVVGITAFGQYSIAQSPWPWSSAVGHWDDQVGSWARQSLPSGAPTTLVAFNTGYIYEDDRATYDASEMVYETKDFLFGLACRITECRFEARMGDFTVSYSLNGGLTYSDETSFLHSHDWSEYVYYLNVTSQTIRFRIKCVSSQIEIRWITPWYIPRKESLALTKAL